MSVEETWQAIITTMLIYWAIMPRLLRHKALCSRKTVVSTYKPTRRYNYEDQHRRLRRCQCHVADWITFQNSVSDLPLINRSYGEIRRCEICCGSKEHNSSWELNRRSASREIWLLWNPKFRCSEQAATGQNPEQHESNPSSETLFHLRQSHPRGFLPSFTFCIRLLHPRCMRRTPYYTWFDDRNNMR